MTMASNYIDLLASGDEVRIKCVLYAAVGGAVTGGVGAGVSPSTALAVGLKVDVTALPREIIAALRAGQVDLTNPAVTVELLRLNAVVGVQGKVNEVGQLTSVGITQAAEGNLTATLTIGVAGHESTLAVPFLLTISPDRISAAGSMVLRQSDLGLTPLRVMLGALQVQDDITVRFRFVATPRS